jgi:hypothetical protein
LYYGIFRIFVVPNFKGGIGTLALQIKYPMARWKPEYNDQYKNTVIRIRHDDKYLHEKLMQLVSYFEQSDNAKVSTAETIRRCLALAYRNLVERRTLEPPPMPKPRSLVVMERLATGMSVSLYSVSGHSGLWIWRWKLGIWACCRGRRIRVVVQDIANGYPKCSA